MTTEPPDTCPICGAAIIQRAERPTDVDYACGLSWYQAMTGRFLNDCRYATRAALRCGATLHPTAREQARDALVAVCATVAADWRAWADDPTQSGNPDGLDRLRAKAYGAVIDAYLATVTP